MFRDARSTLWLRSRVMATQQPLHFGVTLPQIKRTWEESARAAKAFDELGYDSVWVCDHLYGIPAPENDILEAWSQLAAVAAITDHVELGTLVTPPLFRNPAVLAKQIATIDHISGGRVIAGLGAGWFQDEYEGYGIEFLSTPDRMVALEESLELMKLMWTQDEVTYEGRFTKAKGVHCAPKPESPPKILVGGSGEKILMGIAARHADIWNNLEVTQGELAQKVAALHRRCEEHDRDPSTITVSQQCTVVLASDETSAKENIERAKKIYGGHMGGAIEESGIWGTPEQVVEHINRHVEMGCTMFVFEFFGRDTTEPAALFAEQVMPEFAVAQ